jgi:glycosyltransferase involved in cell wall biosynthesis
VVRVFGGALDLDLGAPASPERARLARVVDGAARVLVETDYVAAWLREHHPSARVAIQRNSRALPPAAPAPPPGRKRFVFVGEVSDAKGARELASAMRSAAASGATLDVYGPSRDEAARAVLAAAPSVRMHGEVPNERVPALLAAADALVLPTQHVAEGHPGAILEAFASGRCAIATRHRAIPELVEHERTGLLVPVGDAAALASAIVRLAGDAALCARLGSAAFERARGFDAAAWADHFLAVCREVAAA